MEQLLDQIRNDGYALESITADSKLHRFPLDAQDKKKCAWYVAHTNYRQDNGELYYFVICGNWKTNETKKYCSLGTKLPASQARAHKQQMDAAKKAADEQREADYAAAASEAKEFFDTCSETGTSPYLERKGLPGTIPGIRFDGQQIYVPIRDATDRFLSLEQISPDGRKLSWSGARKASGYFTFGTADSDFVYIAEGFATAASIHLATSAMAVCTFGTGNLKAVCQALKKRYPTKQFVVCGDLDKSDKSNSRKLAEEAAKAILCACVFPNLTGFSEPGLTDFNDLHVAAGLCEVTRQLAQPTALAPIKLIGSEIVETPYPDEDERTGKRRGTIENIKELLRRLNIIVRYNGISKEQEILIPGLATSQDNRDNCTLAHIMSWCERCRIPIGNLQSYLTAVADQNLYNPVRTWIESEAWDGVSRLSEFYATVTATNTPLKDRLIRYWLISAVAAAYEPNGIAAQGVLVFQGEQYVGKTQWFKSLCPAELRADSLELSPSDKDSVIRAIGIWLGELGEIDSTFRKSDIAALKAFITKDTDIVRLPYDRRKSKYARRTVYFGSVNDKEFLYDPTGNRRFWVIGCEAINHAHSVNMQQLWAEVAELYRRGEKWYLTNEEMIQLNSQNEAFQIVEPIEEAIMSNYDWTDSRRSPMTTLAVCRDIGIERPSSRDIRIAAKALQKASGTQRRKTNGHFLYQVAPLKAASATRYVSISQ